MAAMEKTKIPIPQVENTAVVTVRCQARLYSRVCKLTMSRYSTQPRDESNYEASISDDFRKASV